MSLLLSFGVLAVYAFVPFVQFLIDLIKIVFICLPTHCIALFQELVQNGLAVSISHRQASQQSIEIIPHSEDKTSRKQPQLVSIVRLVEVEAVVTSNKHSLDECQHVQATIMVVGLARYDQLIVRQSV